MGSNPLGLTHMMSVAAVYINHSNLKEELNLNLTKPRSLY